MFNAMAFLVMSSPVACVPRHLPSYIRGVTSTESARRDLRYRNGPLWMLSPLALKIPRGFGTHFWPSSFPEDTRLSVPGEQLTLGGDKNVFCHRRGQQQAPGWSSKIPRGYTPPRAREQIDAGHQATRCIFCALKSLRVAFLARCTCVEFGLEL